MFKTNQSFKYDYKFIIRKKIYKQVGKLIFIIIFLSYLFEGGNKTMAIDELQLLEKNLETWIYHIRSMKVRTNTLLYSKNINVLSFMLNMDK